MCATDVLCFHDCLPLKDMLPDRMCCTKTMYSLNMFVPLISFPRLIHSYTSSLMQNLLVHFRMIKTLRSFKTLLIIIIQLFPGRFSNWSTCFQTVTRAHTHTYMYIYNYVLANFSVNIRTYSCTDQLLANLTHYGN